MLTFIITLTQEFRVPVLASDVGEAIEKAKEILNLSDSIFETDNQEYGSVHAVPIQYNSIAREQAEKNEELYKSNN